MTVGELKVMLEKYPDDMEVANERYSDYQVITEDEWSVVEAVPKRDWVMRSHPTMSDENKATAKMFLLLVGN